MSSSASTLATGYEVRRQQRLLAQERNRDRLIAARLDRVDQVRRALVDLEGVQVDVVEAVALGERLGELVGVDDAGVDQRLAERHAAGATLLDGLLHELALREAELDDHVSDAALRAGSLRGRPESRHGERAGGGGRTVAHGSGIGSRRPQVKACQAGSEALAALSMSEQTCSVSTMSVISKTRRSGPAGQTTAKPLRRRFRRLFALINRARPVESMKPTRVRS